MNRENLIKEKKRYKLKVMNKMLDYKKRIEELDKSNYDNINELISLSCQESFFKGCFITINDVLKELEDYDE